MQAYISSVTDDTCLTVTVKAADLTDLTKEFQTRGLRVKPVHVQGRFHSEVHSGAADKLTEFSEHSVELQFPAVDKLRTPLRSAVNGQVITEGSLFRLALENTLLKPADWYGTLHAAILQLPDTHKVAAFAGFGIPIPPSLVQNSGLQLLSLSSLEAPKASRYIKQSPPAGLVDGASVDEALLGEQTQEAQYPSHSIAVVGMSGRFPGADSLDELWELLLSGKVMVERAPHDRLGLSGADTGDTPGIAWWGNFLRNPDTFDHRFFKKSSREAIAWDPQQRILLEVVYEALESAGYFGVSSNPEPDDYGCYIGAVNSNYYDNVSCHPPTAYATLGTSRCFLSGCISHYFGWTGPSLSIDTACSSSLVAINTACRAIWSGECSRAIAGGTSIFTSPFDYQNLRAAGFLSPSGGCKPFDASADGYCRGEGVGVVVLKPLAAAIRENDNILGVVVGSAANQNYNCSHITVPHSRSQINLYHKVMSLSGVEPASVSYVEAHGTGTVVGDPIECQSIREAFGSPSRETALHFGSIKANIGHTEATAGVAGLIKVLLMMQHGKIPPQASHTKLNPKIPALEFDRMEIPRSILPWNCSTRLACVNSYGAAGSNAAVILREKPTIAENDRQNTVALLSKYPLFISAATANSLSMYSQKLMHWLKQRKIKSTKKILMSDLTFNLADRANHSLPQILSVIVTDLHDLEEKLAIVVSGTSIATLPTPKPAVIVFGGQESDFIGVSEDVYRSSSLFRHHLDKCNEILISLGFEGLYPAIFQHTPVSNLVSLHSALFAVQYSSAKAWIDSGFQVSAVVGHSFGQLTAFCISGTLSLPDTLKLVAERASIMLRYWGPEPGSMISLQTSQQEVLEILNSLKAQGNGNDAEIACYNGPKSHVVVGTAKAIDTLEKYVTSNPSFRDTLRVRRLQVTHGFHSKFTEPLLPHLIALAKEVAWRRPTIHLEICDNYQSVTKPDFHLVANHTRRPVFFQQAVERLAQRYSQSTWLEAGRGSSVIQLVRGSLRETQGHVFLSPQLTTSNAHSSLSDTTVELWKAGYVVQYWPFHRSQKAQYQFLSLPPYQFEKTRHWLPFTGRSDGKETVPNVAQEKPYVHELLTFLRFKDDSKKEAIFRIAPQSDRFKSMLGGHTMAGHCLAPASLYFELAARAALSLQSDTAVMSYVPSVDNLLMKSPIGLDTTMEIILCLIRTNDPDLSWSFSITVQAPPRALGLTIEPFEQSTGWVHLKKRDDAQVARIFRRFETLIGHRRCEEIMNHPEAEKMQGNHIYRAFNHIVRYGEIFRGIKNVACVRLEAAGRVVMSVAPDDPFDQRLCDTPMTDSFMQIAGFLVNYFNNPSLEDVLVCMKIERIEIGGNFTPDAKEWIIYSVMTEGGESDALCDAYVFEAESKKMVMTALGLDFSKMSQSVLARMLESVNRSSTAGKPSDMTVRQMSERPLGEASEMPTQAAKPVKPANLTKKSSSKRADLLKVLHNVTDIPLEDLKDESRLEDLGIDSLMATEVLNDIRTVLGLTIDLATFLFFPNVQSIVDHIDSKLGGSDEKSDINEVDTPAPKVKILTSNGVPTGANSLLEHSMPVPLAPYISADSSIRPCITSAYNAFKEIRFGYDQLAVRTKAVNFWTQAYPDQARLVLAYVVEAYAELGCDLKTLQPGDAVPEVLALARHKQLVHQFYRVLEDGNLISAIKNGFVRTNIPVDITPAETLYKVIINRYPHHANVNELVKVVGSQLAACLKGEKEGLQLVFGNKSNKKTLEDMYENWPLLRTPTILLGDFLMKAFTNHNGIGKFRLLEIGAGTGGTTRWVINHLQNNGIPFEYTFTDISASLVAAAKKQFQGVGDISFEILDIEKPPKKEYEGAFHVIIATNCIHATRRLDQSLLHLRKMLREDGALTLVEATKNMFWMDIVVGLFEGWWLFEDGRSHALVSETHWERVMRDVGFEEVLWTDGNTPESKTVRVIGAFPSAAPQPTDTFKESNKITEAAVETVVYKKLGHIEISADVYYPIRSPSTKMPIGKHTPWTCQFFLF